MTIQTKFDIITRVWLALVCIAWISTMILVFLFGRIDGWPPEILSFIYGIFRGGSLAGVGYTLWIIIAE